MPRVIRGSASPAQLFVLGALYRDGPTYGYQLRRLSKAGPIPHVFELATGALYGALRTLAQDGHIRSVRTERTGALPERQVFEITDSGEVELTRMRASALTRYSRMSDPVEMILESVPMERVPAVISELTVRQGAIERTLGELELWVADGRGERSDLKSIGLQHRLSTLRADQAVNAQTVQALTDLLERRL